MSSPKSGHSPYLLFGPGIATGSALLWRYSHGVKAAAEYMVSSLELASSMIIISDKSREILHWASVHTIPIASSGAVAFAAVLAVRYRWRFPGIYPRAPQPTRYHPPPAKAQRIPDEKTHFGKIVDYAQACPRGASIRIYVRCRRVRGKLLAAPESYLRRMAQVAKQKHLKVQYIFGLSPEDVQQLSPQVLRDFTELYKQFANVRIVYLSAANTARYGLREDDPRVIVLLGRRKALQHRRDADGAYQHGRCLSTRDRKKAQDDYRDFSEVGW